MHHKKNDVEKLLKENSNELPYSADLENKSKVFENAIEDKELSFLKVDSDKLRSNCIPVPPASEPKKKVMVRKFVKKVGKKDNSKNKIKILVAHTINENDMHILSTEPLKDYHILGSLEEYNTRIGKKEVNNMWAPSEEKFLEERKFQTNQSNALDNWRKKMSERKQLQEHLSECISVHKDNLILGQSDQFRSVQEHRMIIDQAMPFLNNGKGNCVGSEFWKQAESFKKNHDISVTLTKTEKGSISPIEHIGYACHIKEEMGTQGKTTTRSNKVHMAWSKSSYFKKRLEELQSAINFNNLYDPSIDGLEVIGSSLKTNPEEKLPRKKSCIDSSYKDESRNVFDKPSPLVPSLLINSQVTNSSGPSLLINGQCASWLKPSLEEQRNNITIRLLFETEINHCIGNIMKITNQGTTAVHFHWKRVKEKDPFGLKQVNSKQRFYFDVRDGVVLPNADLKIPFFFKSSSSGIFSEIWHFETRPLLCAGAKIEVILKAISSENIQYEEKLKQLEMELNARQVKSMSERIVAEIINGVRTPPRPSSPIKQCKTIEELFNKVNSKVPFQTNGFNKLNDLYNEIGVDKSWDLSLNSIFKLISDVADNSKKEEWIQRLNMEVSNMQKKYTVPLPPSNYDCCYNIVCLWVDLLVTKLRKFRSSLQLEEKQVIVKFENNLNVAQKLLESQKLSIVKKEVGRPVSKTPKEKQKKVNIIKEEEVNIIKVEPQVAEMLITVTAEKNLDDPKYRKYLQYLYIEVYESLGKMANDIETVLS